MRADGAGECRVDGISILARDNGLSIFNRVPDTDKHKWVARPGTRGGEGRTAQSRTEAAT